MAGDFETAPKRFPTTSWSLVALAAKEGPEAEREALEKLMVRYLPAMRAHLVSAKRMDPNEAADLLQDFVTTKVLERDLIAQADRQLGKFRTFSSRFSGSLLVQPVAKSCRSEAKGGLRRSFGRTCRMARDKWLPGRCLPCRVGT